MCGLEVESINHVIFVCSLARQVWAMSNLPLPKNGFDSVALFPNFSFPLKPYKNSFVLIKIRRFIPWLVWFIWKNMNGWLFEENLFLASEVVEKACDERDQWVEAQAIDYRAQQLDRLEILVHVNTWSKPPETWVKCNIGLSWSKRNQLIGVSCVLRDDRGKVLLHSRRCFANQSCLEEANLLVLLWAMESMEFHRVDKVIFSSEYPELIGAATRLKAWLSFNFHSAEIHKALERFRFWRFILENKEANGRVFLIAQSVTKDVRLHSYVLVSFPSWLKRLFESESV